VDTTDRRVRDAPPERGAGTSKRAAADHAVCILDAEGAVLSCNAGFQQLMGYETGEIAGRNVAQFYPDDAVQAGFPSEALRTAAREGKFEREGWRLRKDGDRFWARVTLDPIRDSSGAVTGFAEITRDLTQHRASEKALRESQEQFRLLVQGVTDYAIFLLDKDGFVSNWNPGAQRIKGYLPEEIVGRHFSRFYTEEDRALGMPRTALETARTEGRFEKEGWRVRKDGSRFWAHVLIDPVRGDDGELLGYAKVTRDITERREAQRKLENAREALFQSQKLEAIGQLTGGIAHDFNNLLMVVLGSLELMRKRLPDDPRLVALLDNAAEGAQRGAALTKRLLAFARRQELKQEAVDVPELVAGMRELLQRSLGPSIGIETIFPQTLRHVLADANQLEMVVLNLAVNARDAMPDGGRITISAHESSVSEGDVDGLKPGIYICLSVTDTGTGMDENTVRRATEPFFTTKGPGKGTGLGLSVVTGITEQIGGRFALKSQPGKGTTAMVWLPVAAPDHTVLTAVSQPAPPHEAGHRSLRVLAVDDDELVLTNTIAMLDDLGHTGIPAVSATEALTLLKRGGPIDVVVTDHAMPHMTGLELSSLIRKGWPDLPVILATGFAEIQPGAGAGLPRLAKPFTQEALSEQLARLTLPVKSS
jgi:PAS domain S-box-containing protein